MLHSSVMLHAVAVKKGAVKQLLACCQAAAGRDARQCELAASATCVLTLVLGLDAARDEFAEQNGAHVLRLLLETSQGNLCHEIDALAKGPSSNCVRYRKEQKGQGMQGKCMTAIAS